MSPKKIAILGGGLGGLSAAYELSRPEHAGAYDVTVYQIGWRLGGKGASSRNADRHQRIEEHGLHLWMGCYENAFRVIRDCYDTLGEDWTKAFLPHQTTVLEERYGGAWHHWPTTFPLIDTRPGEHDEVATPLELTLAMMRWMWRLITPQDDDVPWGPPRAAVGGDETLSILVRPLELALAAMSARRPAHRLAAASLDLVRRTAWRLRGHRLDDVCTRRFLLTIDFLAANVIGILREGFLIPPSGRLEDSTFEDWLENLQRIDHLHYPDWLQKHGARALTTESCIVRGLGDAVFNSGFEGSAAAGLNGLIRLNLTFRGSVFFKMAAGMGETVFTPMYRTLRRRGVKFEFFHRVDALRLDDQNRVAKVELAKQVEVDGTYEPLVEVDGLECWPHEPNSAHLSSVPAGLDLEAPNPVPNETRIELRAEEHFDDVVLAISLGGLAPITRELSAADRGWQAMLENIETTATQAVQIWWSSKHRTMGWMHDGAVATAYEESLDTFADMTHLLDVEPWADDVKACSYFVGSLSDAAEPELQPARQRREADEWLERFVAHLLPGAMDRGKVATDKIVDRYDRVNVRPSDRYVLSVPGSGQYRRFADRSGFGRLYLAGDWTKTGMNVGCVEGAVMSGLRAARGVMKKPVKIVGDFR